MSVAPPGSSPSRSTPFVDRPVGGPVKPVGEPVDLTGGLSGSLSCIVFGGQRAPGGSLQIVCEANVHQVAVGKPGPIDRKKSTRLSYSTVESRLG